MAEGPRTPPGPGAALPAVPARHLTVITCMDARFDPLALLGLSVGDAHVLRNGGGIVTDDVVRSLVLSQRLLATDRVVLVHHTECGIHRLDPDALARRLAAETGADVALAFGSFEDPADDVVACAAVLWANPLLRLRAVEGYVYDVARGELRPVALPAPPPGAVWTGETAPYERAGLELPPRAGATG